MVKRVVVAAMLVASAAHADPVEDLVANGVELGQQGDYAQAIAVFKQADARRSRALHACLIGLAYARRALWTQAELFFKECRARELAGDIVPDWIEDEERDLAAKLAAANIPPITIVVQPADAKLRISGFDADEVFAPGVIHLAPGRYEIEARAEGHAPGRSEVVVAAGESQSVEIELTDLTVTHRAPPSTKVPALIVGGGALLVGGGLAVDVLVVQPLHDERTKSRFLYDAKRAEFDRARDVTIGLWAAGALAIGAGVYLAVRHHPEVAVSAAVDRNGGMIAVGWQR